MCDGCWHGEVVLQQRLREAWEGHVCRHSVESTEAVELSGCCAEFCLMEGDAVKSDNISQTFWRHLVSILG